MANPVDIVVVTIGTADSAQAIANSPTPGKNWRETWAVPDYSITPTPIILGRY